MRITTSANLPGLGPVTSLEELNERVRTVERNLAHTPPAVEETFAKKVTKAMRRLVPARPGMTAKAMSSATGKPVMCTITETAFQANESFAEQVTKAVKEQIARHPNSRKAADERAQAERDRYGVLQPRERTKGE